MAEVTLRGRVLEEFTRRPIPNVAVVIDGVPVITDADGRFEAALTPGSYTIKAMHKDYDTLTRTMPLTAGTYEIEILLKPILKPL